MTCCRPSRARIAGVMSLALALGAAAGCNKNTQPTALNVPYSITEITVGTGAEAVVGSTVETDYIGWLYDNAFTDQKGYQFDNSLTRPNLYTFVVGSNTSLPAFERGFIGMKVGGVRRVEVPPDMAYGSVGNGAIPPNATLVFQIYLYTVTPPR